MAVGLPGSARLEASIFFTVLKSISIIGSYVGWVPLAFASLEPLGANPPRPPETVKIPLRLST